MWTLVFRLTITKPRQVTLVTTFMDFDNAPAKDPPPTVRMSWLNKVRLMNAKEYGVAVEDVGVDWFGWVVRDEDRL